MAKKKREEFVEGMVFILKEVKCKWAKVHEPDDRYEEKWTITAVLDNKLAEDLEDVGFNIKIDGDGDKVLEVKTKVNKKNGTKNKAPQVVGSDGRTPFTDNIGNGSTVNIKVYAKYMTVSGKEFLPAYLNAVQVIDHVEYTGGVAFDDYSSGGAPF